jgi:hypothetical protein
MMGGVKCEPATNKSEERRRAPLAAQGSCELVTLRRE